MTNPPFRIEPLNDTHNRAMFGCGEEALDRYFQTQATQDIRRLVANCFVAVESKTGAVVAFYTLSSTSILLADLPSAKTKHLPKYPTLPAIRIGRLAVDHRFQGHGIGRGLLLDAVKRTAAADAAAFALVVDAKDGVAAAFYSRHGFRPVENRPLTLYISFVTAQKALGA